MFLSPTTLTAANTVFALFLVIKREELDSFNKSALRTASLSISFVRTLISVSGLLQSVIILLTLWGNGGKPSISFRICSLNLLFVIIGTTCPGILKCATVLSGLNSILKFSQF